MSALIPASSPPILPITEIASYVLKTEQTLNLQNKFAE